MWVGFDDNRELKLEGAASALPIWTEFMKRALACRGYREAKAFSVPAGVVTAQVCSQSGQLATPHCPSAYVEYFVDGSQPVAHAASIRLLQLKRTPSGYCWIAARIVDSRRPGSLRAVRTEGIR